MDNEYKNGQGYSSSANDLFRTVMKKNEQRGLKALGVVTLALAIISIPLVFVLGLVLSLFSIPESFLLLVLPLPLSSLILGIILFLKNANYKLNLALGAVGVAIVLFSVFVPSTNETSPEAYEYAEFIENKFEIDLPTESAEMYFYEYTEDETAGDGYIKSLTLYLNTDDASAIYESITSDGRFVASLPTSYIGLLPRYSRSESETVALIYNDTLSAYNTAPEDNGTYKMTAIIITVYEVGGGDIEIVEYNLDYRK